jgi:hypothetical protein
VIKVVWIFVDMIECPGMLVFAWKKNGRRVVEGKDWRVGGGMVGKRIVVGVVLMVASH